MQGRGVGQRSRACLEGVSVLFSMPLLGVQRGRLLSLAGVSPEGLCTQLHLQTIHLWDLRGENLSSSYHIQSVKDLPLAAVALSLLGLHMRGFAACEGILGP